jgi:hypothetical protein
VISRADVRQGSSKVDDQVAGRRSLESSISITARSSSLSQSKVIHQQGVMLKVRLGDASGTLLPKFQRREEGGRAKTIQKTCNGASYLSWNVASRLNLMPETGTH